mmetsp:Transcript_99741/g.253598  ORF Transcript_99741/g.253598 Transcript_99741/m.253598 type:complete len:215 (-) Transcript_99741:158-802(-)
MRRVAPRRADRGGAGIPEEVEVAAADVVIGHIVHSWLRRQLQVHDRKPRGRGHTVAPHTELGGLRRDDARDMRAVARGPVLAVPMQREVGRDLAVRGAEIVEGHLHFEVRERARGSAHARVAQANNLPGASQAAGVEHRQLRRTQPRRARGAARRAGCRHTQDSIRGVDVGAHRPWHARARRPRKGRRRRGAAITRAYSRPQEARAAPKPTTAC